MADSAHPLVRKLESIYALSEEERDAVSALPMQIVDVRADQDIVREGDSPTRCCLVLEGLTSVYKVTGEGKRQILALQIAGDIPDLQSLHLRVLDNSIGTISPSKVGFIQHDVLRALCHCFPQIGDALWRTTLIDAAVFREWMVNIGRREAYSRIAHLLCETFERLKAVGLTNDHSWEIRVSQSELGDATSMSTVHVNRTVQDLRRDGLITWEKGRVEILDWDRLVDVGDFDPTYLHLRPSTRGHIYA